MTPVVSHIKHGFLPPFSSLLCWFPTLNHQPNIWLLSSVGAQAMQSHKSVIKHVINILTRCQLNPVLPFPLTAPWKSDCSLCKPSWKMQRSAAQLPPEGKIDGVVCFALLSSRLTAARCTGPSFSVIRRWSHLPVISFYLLIIFLFASQMLH